MTLQSLNETDPAVFEAWLDFLYTGEQQSEGVSVLFEGFHESTREEGKEGELSGIARLREDLLYCWRSKLYADISIVLDDASSTSFSSHRAVLVARVPYFRSLLLGDYLDSHTTEAHLPSPLFSSASLTFILGYIYAGTIHFSRRKFDLTTAFEIYRGALFLSLSQLQSQVICSIEGMITPLRAARIYSFALSPDVCSNALAGLALPSVVNNFDLTWDSAYIGNLDYSVQRELVVKVVSLIEPESVTDVARRTHMLRGRLELNRNGWADHVKAMLDAIEEELVINLSRDLPKIVTCQSFINLIDGVGFSIDVLEWMLELAVRGLSETEQAPLAYQALVGSVLLREQRSLRVDARILVEDARNGISLYIKRRWPSIRMQRGFERLDLWCLKELADGESRKESTRSCAKGAHRIPDGHITRPILTDLGVQEGDLLSPAQSLRRESNSASSSRPEAVNHAHSSRSHDSLNGRFGPRQQSVARPLPASAAPRVSNRLANTAVWSTLNSPLARRGDESRAEKTVVATKQEGLASRAALASKSSRHYGLPLYGSTTSPNVSIDATSKPRIPTDRFTPSVGTSITRAAGSAIHESSSSKPALGTPKMQKGWELAPIRTRTKSTARVTASTVSFVDDNVADGACPGGVNTRLAPRNVPMRSVATVRAQASRSQAANRTSNNGPKDEEHTRERQPALSGQAIKTIEATGMVTQKRNAGHLGEGTVLLSGVACVVTLNGDGEKTIRFKAKVRYLGRVAWSSSSSEQWIGVEVAASAIPPEAVSLQWTDGSVEGIRYFPLGIEEYRADPHRPPSSTPSVEEAHDGRHGSSPSGSQPKNCSGLREPVGTSKAIFVRPWNIVYIF